MFHVMFMYCKYMKFWHPAKIELHPSLHFILKRMEPKIEVQINQFNLFHPTHNAIIHRSSPHNEEHRIDDQLKKSTLGECRRDIDSPHSLMIEITIGR